MGHNISQRREVCRALALSLGQFRTEASVLAVTCEACAETRELRLSTLGEQYGFDLLLGTVVLRLRCRHCRAAPGAIQLAKHPGAPGLGLRGPGSA